MTPLPVTTVNNRRVLRWVEVSPAEIREAVDRYQAGEGIEPLARSMGLGSRTMRKILVEAGVAIRSSGQPWRRSRQRAETARDAEALYKASNSIHRTSTKLELPYSTIRKLLVEQGVQFRHPAARPRRGDHPR